MNILPDKIIMGPNDDSRLAEFAKAYAALARDRLLKDPDFMGPGRRNNDTVDYMVACHVLGISENEIRSDAYMHPNLANNSTNRNRFDQCSYRVAYYLHDWGPEGHEHFAIDYMTRSYSEQFRESPQVCRTQGPAVGERKKDMEEKGADNELSAQR